MYEQAVSVLLSAVTRNTFAVAPTIGQIKTSAAHRYGCNSGNGRSMSITF
jgi:hypothetical protein